MNTNYILTDRQTGKDYSVVPKGLSEKGELEMWAILVDDEEELYSPQLIRFKSWGTFFERFGLND